MPADTLTATDIDAIQDRFATDGDPTHDDVWALIDHALSEPTRLASARAEGVREGIEMAALWCRVRAYCAATREREATDEQSRRAALLVKQTLDHAADVLPALSPPPAEPKWTPTHEHYKGGLYRELMRGRREGSAEPMVAYQAENGDVWFRPVDEFDAEIDPGGGWMRRYEPIPHSPPAEPTGGTAEPVQTGDGWIEWKGGECPVDRKTIVDVRFRLGDTVLATVAGEWAWMYSPDNDGDIVAYRIVQPAEPSAPVALTRCQAASLRNDGECSHPLCPVARGEPGVDRLRCTLPGAGVDYVDEDDLPPSAPVAEGM